MSALFTPGPWFAKREGSSTVYIEARLRGSTLQEVAACGPTETVEQQEANAHLIAAAPRMYDALTNLCAVWKSHCNANGWEPSHVLQYDEALAALIKARGQA